MALVGSLSPVRPWLQVFTVPFYPAFGGLLMRSGIGMSGAGSGYYAA